MSWGGHYSAYHKNGLKLPSLVWLQLHLVMWFVLERGHSCAPMLSSPISFVSQEKNLVCIILTIIFLCHWASVLWLLIYHLTHKYWISSISYETGSLVSQRLASTHYVAKDDLGLLIFLPLLPNAGITGVGYCARIIWCWELNTGLCVC